MYHVRLFIVEKMGFGTAPRWCGIHSKHLPLLQKTCLSYAFETLVAYAGTCLYTHALARVCRSRPTYVGRGLLWSFYFQNRLFLELNSDRDIQRLQDYFLTIFNQLSQRFNWSKMLNFKFSLRKFQDLNFYFMKPYSPNSNIIITTYHCIYLYIQQHMP